MVYRRSATFFALALILSSGGLVATVSLAGAATVTCGEVITTDTVLDADVGPCPGNGIVIGASGITLDLNGHTVFGSPATPTPHFDEIFPVLSGFNGILVAGPHGGVRIRNGTVSGFADGVTIWQSTGNTIERLIVQDHRCQGVRLHGVNVFVASGNLVRENLVRGNGCSGIRLQQAASGNTVERNQITANRAAGVHLQASGPINAPRGNLVRQNSVTGNGLDGVYLSGFTSGTRVVANLILANGANGVDLAGAFSNEVDGNQIRRNAANGVVARGGSSGTVQNRITQNLAVENGVGTGGFDLAEESSACPNTWSGNTFLTRNRACIS